MAHKKSHDEEEHENHERYLVTYADMLTLLLALFIVLYAMSSLNKSKYEAFQASFSKKKVTGQPDLTQPNPQKMPVKPKPGHPVITNTGLMALKKDLQSALAAANLSKAADLSIDSNGLSISLTDGVLFNSGQADLLPDGLRVLNVISPKLADKKVGNDIKVEGHTDDVPIKPGGKYADNWELSGARANSVLRYFLVYFHIAPDRLSFQGFADTKPKVANTSEANRAENRRVVVLVQATS
jgi:chemotaxis protein MotB